MKRDKFILIQSPLNIVSPSGGSRSIWTTYCSGWANVVEGNYNTTLQEGQFDGRKGITFSVKKNSLTEKITTAMRVDFRGEIYLIQMVKELDRFTLELSATQKDISSSEPPPIEIDQTNLDFTIESSL